MVVLIIGILAAVALPEDTLAVNRTRFANLRTLVASFVESAQVYRMSTGNWPDNFTDTGLSLPGNFQVTTPTSGSMQYTCENNDEIYCCMIPGKNTVRPVVICARYDESFAYHYVLDNSNSYCVADPDNTNAKKLCKSLTGKGGNLIWGLYTPTGYKTPRMFYGF